MSMTKADLSRVDDRAELAVRRYFDRYLLEVFPVQLAAAIASHDNNHAAHGGVIQQAIKNKYLLIGFVAAGGFGGGVASGLLKLAGFV
jgi:hypothetical protein